MKETYLYFTKARIFLILITITLLVLLCIRIEEPSTWQEAVMNIAVTFGLGAIFGWLEAELVKHPPIGVDEIVEHGNATFSTNNVIGKMGYDEAGNELGECTGAYFTDCDIRLMVGGHLYGLNEVYFEEEEE